MSGNDLCSVESPGSPPEEEGRLAGILVKNNPEPCVAHISPSFGGYQYRSIGERDIVENNSIRTWVKYGEEQLIKAVSSGNFEEVKRGLAEGISPNCHVNNMSILALAIKNVNFDIVRILLKKGANPALLLYDPSVPGFVEKAYQNRHYDVAQKLLDNGQPIDKERLWNFFQSMVTRRESTGIEFCLKNGIDVNRLYWDCSPIVNLLWRSVAVVEFEGCSFARSLRVMVNYGADIENVVWNREKFSLLSCYFELKSDSRNFVNNYNFYQLRELLLLGCRISDEVVQKLRKIRNHCVLDMLARGLNVPGDIEVLPLQLLQRKILRAIKIMSSSPRGGSLKDLSSGVITWNVSHHREPDEAIDSLPLPAIVKTRLKEFGRP